MLTIILEDYGLGDFYTDNFTKLNEFMKLTKQGIIQYIPKLKRFFKDESSLLEMVIMQWIITLFTMDFSIELAFWITDMFLVFGWKAIFGWICSILKDLESTLVRTNEEEASTLIKKFIKEGNIDFDSFFSNTLKYKIESKDLKKLGRKFYKAFLSEKIWMSLSNQSNQFGLFSTYDVTPSDVQKLEEVKSKEDHSVSKQENYIKIEKTLKYHKRNKNRIPKKYENKNDKIRLSSANHYKPLDNIRSPLPIQVTSDEEEEMKSIERAPYVDQGAFMIPNEGNVNKSPMFLLNKDNKVSHSYLNL